MDALISDGILNKSEIESINSEKVQKNKPNHTNTQQVRQSASAVKPKPSMMNRGPRRVIGGNRIRISTRRTGNMNVRKQPCCRPRG